MALRDELLALLEGCDLDLEGELRDDSSLLRSGLLDSTALLTLALWIEERIDAAVDLTQFDLAKEWDTPSEILAFVRRHGAAKG